MRLRIATLEDREAVMGMAYSFYKSSPYKDIPLDGAKVVSTVRDFIGSPNTLCLLALDELTGTPIGVIAGHISEMIFSTQRMASEAMWWIDPKHRGLGSFEMMEAFEYWAKLKGCTHVQMSLLGDTTGDRLTKIYNKKGYTRSEVAFIKEI